jgi:hypothetical protein
MGSLAPSAPEAAPSAAESSTTTSSSSAASGGDAPTDAAGAAAAEARAALRAVLRAVDAHFTSVAGNRQWRDYVLEQARKLRAEAAAQQGAAKVIASATETARDYASLVETVARHRRLLREYNIGLDPDERNRQMVEKTAARVGFSIPQPAVADGDEEEEEEAKGQQAAGGGGKAGDGAPSIARRAAMARAAAAAGTFGGGAGGGGTSKAGRRAKEPSGQ